MRRLHNRSVCTLVPTPTLAQDLRQQGYRNVQVVSRGVDMNTFAASRRSDALRRQWGIKPGGLAVAYVGRWKAQFLTPSLPECGTVMILPRTMPPPTCSCSPA